MLAGTRAKKLRSVGTSKHSVMGGRTVTSRFIGT